MNRNQAATLLQERARLVGNARAIAEQADREHRGLTGSDKQTLKTLDDRIARIDHEVAADFDRQQSGTPEARSTGAPSASLEAWVRGEHRSRAIEVSHTQGVSDIEGRALGYVAPGGMEYHVQTVGSATAGGDLIPTDFYSQLVRVQVFNSNILAMSPTILDTEGGHSIQVPTVGPTYGAAVAVSENATAAPADDTFGQTTLKAFKFEAFVQYSRELIDDSGIDVVGYLANDAGRKLTNKFGAKLVTGAGTTEPLGLITAVAAAVTAASASLTFDNVISLYHAVVPQYRANGAFLMNDTTVSSLRQLKDSNGRYLLDISTVPGAPDTFWGRPVYQDPSVPAIGHSNISLVFGDPKGFFVRRSSGVRFERSDEFAFDKDLVTFRAIARNDSALVDSNSMKAIVHA